MRQAAAYVRYSDEEQRPTSIDDQLRRIREKAKQLGYTVADEHVFVDAAITGQAKGLAKRAGYNRLIADWEKRPVFEAVIVDEISRLGRDGLELAKMQQRVERTGIRLVSCDGLDSATPGWQLPFAIAGMIAQHAVRETRHRVIRGMQGQLERGYMIGYPPFGYRQIRVGAAENEGGTRWEVDEDQAQWVRRAFEMRYAGRALGAIAEFLNRQGVPSPRKARKQAVSYWRPATVRQLLQNSIYRGVFVWNGSPFAKAKAKRERQTLNPVEYDRPQLRLVSDAVWRECNQPSGARHRRGGAKHVFASLVSCGTCHAKLTVASGGSARSLYCAQCAQAKRVGVIDRPAHYVSATALQKALEYVLEQALTDECVAEFRRRLRTKLEGGHTARVDELKVLLARSDRSLERLAHLIRRMGGEEGALEQAYQSEAIERNQLRAELARLEDARAALDVSAIERQLTVDPRRLLHRLFGQGEQVDATRAVLSRVFPRIELAQRPSRFVAVWRVSICPGAILAEVSDTETVLAEVEEMLVRVETGASRPVQWRVSELERRALAVEEEKAVV